MNFSRSYLFGLVCTFALAQAPSEVPYVVGSTQLSDYHGTDIKRMILALNKPAMEKDKFESETDYKKRMDQSQKGALFGNIYRDSLLALCVSIETAYDFEKGLFVVKAPRFKKIDVTDMPFSWGNKAHQIDLSTTSKVVTKQNAYGAKLEVEQSTTIRTLAVLKLKFRDEAKFSEYKWSGMQFDLKMTPDMAKELDTSIRLIVIGNLLIPNIIQGTRISDSATFNNPQESFEYQQIVGLNPKSIILYDSKKGTIYKQFNCND